MTVVHIADHDLVVEPYQSGARDGLLATERLRIRTLLLENAIGRRMREQPGARHVVISFYATGAGFRSQIASMSLGIPHIAAVRGTDYELEIFDNASSLRLRTVVEAAGQVVTTNETQARSLSTLFRLKRPARTIYNALPDLDRRPEWTRPPAPPVRLFSDGGLSGRKGTHLLVRAVSGILDDGWDVSLTIAGGVFFLESKEYWTDFVNHWQSEYPRRVCFLGHITHEAIESQLFSSHIYCSASLAEGCSMSRVRAMTLGIPMVVTETGGMRELAPDCPHIRLCRPGDIADLRGTLETAVQDIQRGALEPDCHRVAVWRRQFSLERERDEWIAAIDAATGT
jgi:glycosyltransferase involved in cell wall biosynthesis